MNLRIFAESLTLDELNQLSNILYNAKKKYFRENMKPLTNDEKALVTSGNWIEAIKVYRARLGCSLLEAKIAIDSIRSNREND